MKIFKYSRLCNGSMCVIERCVECAQMNMNFDSLLDLGWKPGNQTGIRILAKAIKFLRTSDWTILTIDAYGIDGEYNGMVRVKDGMWILLKELVPVPSVNILGRLIREIVEAEETPSSGE